VRGELSSAIVDSETRVRGELSSAIVDSETRVRGELSSVIAGSETRVRSELGARIDVSADETRRHMGVVAEDLKSKIAVVAEGIVTLTEKLAADMREGFDVVDRRLLRLETRSSPAPRRD